MQSCDPSLSSSQLVEQVKRRLSFFNIFKEVALIPHMTATLTIEISKCASMDILSGRKEEELMDILTQVPFLEVKTVGQGEKKRCQVRLDYKLSQTLVVVTGVHQEALNKLLFNYNSHHKKMGNGQYQKEAAARRVTHNGFFTLFEAYSVENAANLKGYLRTKKKFMDERPSSCFKVDNRKIRIFGIGQEDLFTFIVDMMSEYKAEKFIRSMDTDRSRMRRPPPPQSIQYRMFGAFYAPSPKSRLLEKQAREREQPKAKAKVKAKEEDASSDSTCLTSDLLDKCDIGEEVAYKGFFSVQQSQEGKE